MAPHLPPYPFQRRGAPTASDPRDRRDEREAALGLVTPADAVCARALGALGAAYHNLDMAERHQQPPFVLDKFEREYFAALARYMALAPCGGGTGGTRDA